MTNIVDKRFYSDIYGGIEIKDNSEFEKDILYMRYGLGNEEEMTQKDIGWLMVKLLC